jgi:hypothetical protein
MISTCACVRVEHCETSLNRSRTLMSLCCANTLFSVPLVYSTRDHTARTRCCRATRRRLRSGGFFLAGDCGGQMQALGPSQRQNVSHQQPATDNVCPCHLQSFTRLPAAQAQTVLGFLQSRRATRVALVRGGSCQPHRATLRSATSRTSCPTESGVAGKSQGARLATEQRSAQTTVASHSHTARAAVTPMARGRSMPMAPSRPS